MSYVIRVYLLTTGQCLGYLTGYDPDHRPDGKAVYPTGQVQTSSNPADAIIFQSREAAVDVVARPSERVPYRPDGAPNRPITAYTVEILPREEAT